MKPRFRNALRISKICRIWHVLLIAILLQFSFIHTVSAQQDSLTFSIESDSVFITATRIKQKISDAPYAITLLRPDFISKGQQRLSLKESLDFVPGVFTMNAENYAQDIRISIRGFGARSAFGIRGIKILVDGVPESTPDGQGQTDNLDINAIQNMEILRGPVSGLYGNASGGLLSVSTATSNDKNSTELFAGAGSFGYRNLHIMTHYRYNKWNATLQATNIRTEGYRTQSAMQNTILNTNIGFQLNEQHMFALILNYANSPQADDPGGLTASELANDRRMAAPANVRWNAGESVKQSKIALRWLYSGERLESEVNTWYIHRDFENFLPFTNGGVVNLKRDFPGITARFTYRSSILKLPWTLSGGVDAELQQDFRLRFNNTDGIKGETSVFRQQEIFRNTGVYLLNKIHFHEKLEGSISLRQDLINIEARPADREREQLDYAALNPSVGMNWRVAQDIRLYANYSTNFESPALIELSNNPSGGTGFNADLLPQTAKSGELGVRYQPAGSIQTEAALYYIRIKDEILPYELAQFPQRIFYRNAGNTVRKGMEISLNYRINEALRLFNSWTVADFRYEKYMSGNNDFKGNRPAAQPLHQFFSDLRYIHQKGWFAILNAKYTSALFADDANTISEKGFTLLHLKTGKEMRFSRYTIEPCIGIQNLTNSRYNSNIRINAAAGRYYEPAPERHWFVSIRMKL
jgi:iron complex outermembrane recepter protein